MAVLKIRSSSDARGLSKLKDYLEKDNRASRCSGMGIDDLDHWVEDMQMVKSINEKTGGVQFYTIIQSFDKEQDKESYNVDDVHLLGRELVQELADKGFQVVVETHADTDNLHNHIIINSVNAITGKKLQISKAKDLANTKGADILEHQLYERNDALCKRSNLRTLDESKAIKDERDRANGRQPTSRRTDEIYLEQKNKSFKDIMRDKLQSIWQRSTATTQAEFDAELAKEELSISKRTGTGNISYQDKEGHTARAKSLGAFNQADIDQLMERNRQRERTQAKSDAPQSISRTATASTTSQRPFTLRPSSSRSETHRGGR